jgi:hypothetical protein
MVTKAKVAPVIVAAQSDIMSRLCVGDRLGLLQPSSVVVEALLHVAKMDAFRDTWMPTDDFASIIHASFNLPITTSVLPGF